MEQTSQSPDEPCELCGEGVNRLGTRVDLEVFYEDYKYAGYPAFCSWEHAAQWFANGKPDFTTWDKSDAKVGDHAWMWPLAFFLVFVLAVVGAASLVALVF